MKKILSVFLIFSIAIITVACSGNVPDNVPLDEETIYYDVTAYEDIQETIINDPPNNEIVTEDGYIITTIDMFATVDEPYRAIVPNSLIHRIVMEDNESGFARYFAGNEHTFGLYAHSMPTVGTPHIAVFVVDFPNDPPMRYSVYDIEQQFFDNSRVNEPVIFQPPHYADEGFNISFYSMRDFFYRSSYGKLDITGDMFTYTMQRNSDDYADWTELLDEVMTFANTELEVDWSRFDASGTGYTDGIFIAFRGHTPAIPGGGIALMGPNYYDTNVINEVQVANIAFMQGVGLFNNNVGLVHEAVHLMGLLDIDLHAGLPLNPAGPGATTVMNAFATIGDIPGIMKYVFGWIDPIRVATVGRTEVSLKSMSDYPQLAIIHPHGDINNPNWFIVEYITGTNNNFGFDENATIHEYYGYPTIRPGGGLRIWRVTIDPEFITRHELGNWQTAYFVEPYVFIEAVHHHREIGTFYPRFTDHFFYPGDSFTPHTQLNSNYPRSFREPGDGTKIMEDMADSGIYLENIRIDDGVIHFTVTIRRN
ncbi:MAG: hypothetical protein FWD05_11760 [Oscillospiraceae bacterium]|nr:hypothetical protein [Oscillospiraceae bacterium]